MLELGIPFREQIEVLYVKLLLKPLEQLDQKMPSAALATGTTPPKPSEKDQMQMAQTEESKAGEVSFLSDTEDNAPSDDNRI